MTCIQTMTLIIERKTETDRLVYVSCRGGDHHVSPATTTAAEELRPRSKKDDFSSVGFYHAPLHTAVTFNCNFVHLFFFPHESTQTNPI